METKNLVVTKHTELIEASYKLNLEEQRLLLLCIAKIDSRGIIPDEITITSKEYSQNYGMDIRHAYQQLFTLPTFPDLWCMEFLHIKTMCFHGA